MKQELIDKFNAVTDETVEDYCKAKDGGFCWLWFLERARLKIMESGYLPQQGTALIDARYNNSADAVLDGLLCAARSVESPAIRATKAQPWEGGDLERWKQGLLAFSAMMFDAGCVAAYTRGYEDGFDPVEANAPAAILATWGLRGCAARRRHSSRRSAGSRRRILPGKSETARARTSMPTGISSSARSRRARHCARRISAGSARRHTLSARFSQSSSPPGAERW